MPLGWPSINEQQRIQPNGSHQKTHSGFYLQDLKAILLYSQLAHIPYSLMRHRKHCAFVWKQVIKRNWKAIVNEVFFRDPFFHHFLVFAFVSWIIKLKAGWHPHAASQVWNTKDNSRSRDSLLSSEWLICLSPLGFLLLTQHLFPLFLSLSLCECRLPSLPHNCSDSCLARDERNGHCRAWSDVRACREAKCAAQV